MTVADVLRHESGLASLTETFNVEDMETDNLANNGVGKAIENSKQVKMNPGFHLLYNIGRSI